MTRTANEQVLDDMIVRQIHLLRFSEYLSNKLIAIVASSEEEVGRLIRDELRNMPTGQRSAKDWKTLFALADRIEYLRSNLWVKAGKEAVAELESLVEDEAEAMRKSYLGALPFAFLFAIPALKPVKREVSRQYVQGATVDQWMRSLAASDSRRIRAALVTGANAGESASRIAQRVVGREQLRNVDGATRQGVGDVRTVVRTAVIEGATLVRQRVAEANSNVLADEEQFVAVLDRKTTPQCRSLDGRVFPKNKGPKPPLHFNCRSMRVAFFSFAKVRRLAENAKWKDQWRNLFGEDTELTAVGAKALRDYIGPTPEPEVYSAWLQKQSAAIQNNILGITRARLFRKGKLTLDKFVDYTGTQYSLAELAKRHPAAFKRAGLNVKDF